MLFYNEFLATVRDESQQISKQRIAAPSMKSAVFQLKKQRYRVITIERRKNPFVEALKQGRLELGGAASKRDLSTFSNNLSLMV